MYFLPYINIFNVTHHKIKRNINLQECILYGVMVCCVCVWVELSSELWFSGIGRVQEFNKLDNLLKRLHTMCMYMYGHVIAGFMNACAVELWRMLYSYMATPCVVSKLEHLRLMWLSACHTLGMTNNDYHHTTWQHIVNVHNYT